MRLLRYLTLALVVLATLTVFFFYKGDIPKDVVDARYTSPTSQFLTLENGARVHFRDEGNFRGPTIVLIHGSNASLHTWEPWVAELGDRFRIVSLDLPAHGLTGAVPDGNYTMAAYVATVRAIVEHLSLDSYYLGGNSMGGGVTWRYTLDHADEVRGMLLINASSPRAWREQSRTEENNREAPLVFSLLQAPWFRAVANRLDPYYLVKQGLESAYNHSPVVNEQLIMRYYDLALRAGSREATLARFSAPRDTSPVDLSVLTMPALVMWGREDALIPVSVADDFEAALPNTEVVIYDDVGHVPMEEIPARSAADIAGFIEASEALANPAGT